MDPLISEDEFSIEIDQIFDDDFQKVHPIILKLGAKFKHVGQVEHMSFNAAELMRVVFFEALDYGALVVRVLEELSEALPGPMGGSWIDERFYEEVIDDFAGLFAFTSIDSEYFEEEMLVVGEGCLKPIDSM